MATAFSLNVKQARATFRSSSSTSHAMSKMDQSFTTWSFDKPCMSMEWSELAPASLSFSTDTANWEEGADLVVVGVFAPKKDEEEDEDDSSKKEKEPTVELTGGAKALDEKLGGALSDIMLENAKEFNHGATAGSTTPTLRIISGGKAQRYVVMGLGTVPGEDGLTGVGSAVGKTVATTCNAEKKVASAKVLLPEAISGATVLKDLSSSFYTGLYSDNRYRTGDKKKVAAEDLKTVTFVSEASSADGADDALAAGKKLAAGIYMTRDIVNSPHNVLNSESLAATAKRIAEESGGTLKCTILGKEECEERGMGAYLGVARGSETDPQFIHITYTPPDGVVNKKVGIVGKGLLYDTGGYNIKTQGMELMKFDCGGAAAVLGAARAIAALKPPGVEAHFVVAACENMINEKAMVASDILTASNGKTIEVLNTDAEGRLTLADALVYCDKELDCESIIELSTLTGACMVALGKGISGMWTDNDDLAKELQDVAKVTEEKSWRMPMEKSYNKMLDSKVADLQNIGGKYAGSITAALFLQNFVNKKKPFAHIDIAGPVWDDSTGATGYGAKLVTEWVSRQGEKKE
jgi:leucyl aminopeptidase